MKIFLISQNLNLFLVIFFFDERLIFFWLILVYILKFDFPLHTPQETNDEIKTNVLLSLDVDIEKSMVF